VNNSSNHPEASPILIVPYVWIGDFVRCHSVVRLLEARWPHRPIDLITSSLCAPLLDYMPGVRQGIVCDLPRGRLPIGRYLALGRRLKAEHYGTALIMLRTWKAALAPFLAGIPERTGFFGELRFGLINDLRWGERRLKRMIDCMGALALPKSATLPPEWPLPEIVVPPEEIARWLERRALAVSPRPLVALAPGAVGPGKRWASGSYAELARRLTAAGIGVWVLGGPNEAPFAREIVAAAGDGARDLTGNDLRDAVIALAAVDAAVSNDSGLMHVAAAIGIPTVALFGPTDPRLWGPLNPLAAAIEPPSDRPCPRCARRNCDDVRHRDVDEITVDRVFDAVTRTLASRK
jgi:lipopolysaccharide heptosyltransferase II